jgi:multidrug efflux pump subunit AcrB
MSVKLDCDYTAWRFNTAVMTPAVIAVTGVILGIWLMGVHNCIWAWLTKRRQKGGK